jgi:hypothetical protein
MGWSPPGSEPLRPVSIATCLHKATRQEPNGNPASPKRQLFRVSEADGTRAGSNLQVRQFNLAMTPPNKDLILRALGSLRCTELNAQTSNFRIGHT